MQVLCRLYTSFPPLKSFEQIFDVKFNINFWISPFSLHYLEDRSNDNFNSLMYENDLPHIKFGEVNHESLHGN